MDEKEIEPFGIRFWDRRRPGGIKAGETPVFPGVPFLLELLGAGISIGCEISKKNILTCFNNSTNI
jgi:hypothetical protein